MSFHAKDSISPRMKEIINPAKRGIINGIFGVTHIILFPKSSIFWFLAGNIVLIYSPFCIVSMGHTCLFFAFFAFILYPRKQ